MFVRINCCPICSSEDFQFQSHAASNLYSEKIASELGISETELLENVRIFNFNHMQLQIYILKKLRPNLELVKLNC